MFLYIMGAGMVVPLIAIFSRNDNLMVEWFAPVMVLIIIGGSGNCYFAWRYNVATGYYKNR